MSKKSRYADLYTLRADGRYYGWYRDAAGKRHAVYDRDPEQLYRKLIEKQAAAQHPEEPTFRAVAESWEGQHREEITDRTWKNYKPHYEDLLDRYGDYFNGLIRSGIDPEVARGIIDRLTTQQSIMLATNTVMQACAVVLVIAAFSIWFGPNTNRIRAELARRSTQKS